MNVFEFMKATRPIRELGNLGNQATGPLFGSMFGGNVPFGSAFDQQSGLDALQVEAMRRRQEWARQQMEIFEEELRKKNRRMAEGDRYAGYWDDVESFTKSTSSEQGERECAEGRHDFRSMKVPVAGEYNTQECRFCGHTEEVLEAEYTVAALPPKE